MTVEITSALQGVQLRSRSNLEVNNSANAVQTMENQINVCKESIKEKEKIRDEKRVALDIAKTEFANVKKLYTEKKKSVDIANEAYNEADKAVALAVRELEDDELVLASLNHDLIEATNKRNIVEQAYADYQRKSKNKYNKLYNTLAGGLAGACGLIDFSRYYEGRTFKDVASQVKYMQGFLEDKSNFERVWHENPDRIVHFYYFLMDDSRSMSEDEIKADIDEMLYVTKDYSEGTLVNVNMESLDDLKSVDKEQEVGVVIPTESTDSGFDEEEFKKSTSKFNGFRVSRKKSAIDLGKRVYMASVINGSLKKLEWKGDDSIVNQISLFDFLGKGKIKEYKNNARVVQELNKLSIQALTFTNENGLEDVVFAGDVNDGCLAYRNLDKAATFTYKQRCVEANNTHLVAMIYVALTESDSRFKKYADEYFSNQVVSEENQFGKEKGLLFLRDESYADSPLNYYPYLGRYNDKYIYTGSHNGFDKVDKRNYCLNMMADFAEYCAGKLRWKPATLKKFLRSIILWGWYDIKELNKPLVIVK